MSLIDITCIIRYTFKLITLINQNYIYIRDCSFRKIMIKEKLLKSKSDGEIFQY